MRSGGHAWRGRPEMTECPSLAADPPIRPPRALAEATDRLSRAGVPSPSAHARAPLARAARTDRSPLLLDRLPERFADDLEQLTERRTAREPLQLTASAPPPPGTWPLPPVTTLAV